MASVNKATIIGHLGKDPEVRYLPSGEAVTNFTIATSETWKDKNTGEKKEQTEWHRVNTFGKLAEICGQYLKKGALVYVEGRLQTRKWEKDGHTNYTTEIKADQMKMLGGKSDGAREPVINQDEGKPQQSNRGAPGGVADFEDDIPFDQPFRKTWRMI